MLLFRQGGRGNLWITRVFAKSYPQAVGHFQQGVALVRYLVLHEYSAADCDRDERRDGRHLRGLGGDAARL